MFVLLMFVHQTLKLICLCMWVRMKANIWLRVSLLNPFISDIRVRMN